MNVVGYVRVSTTEQGDSGAGLAAQRKALHDAARIRGWVIVGIYEDVASGSSLEKRPGLDAALRIVRTSQPEARVLVVAKLDRLSRSLMDFAAITEQARRQNWAIIALDLGVDTTTAAGEMMANVLATFAQFERRLIGERTKAGMAAKKAQGVHCGRTSEVPAAVAGYIRGMRANGDTYAQIARWLTTNKYPTPRGSKVWNVTTVRKVALRG